MHPEILSITLFGIVAAFTPGPNNFVAFYSGFNFGIVRTLPHIIGVTLGFPFLLLCLARHNNKNGKPRVTPIICGSVLTIPKLKPE